MIVLFISKGKKGKRASCQRDRERERERERESERWRVAENRGSDSCKNCRWRNGPFRISQDQNRRIILIARNYFNGQG